MSKLYKLSLSIDYLPSWDISDGIRELLQNAKDAETEHNAKMEVEFKTRKVKGKDVGAMVITNTGCTMPLKVLLIGQTTKLGNDNTIGQFGEGLKFGILALLRAGLRIKIRNGSDVWEPKIIFDEDFNTRVLAFEVSTGRKSDDRVMFEILGISKIAYDQSVAKCLWLGIPPKSVNTFEGDVIIDPDYAGKIFVKGIYVCNTGTTFGFNFAHAEVDRDRRMLTDQSYALKKIISAAADDEVHGKMISKYLFENLLSNSGITEDIHWNLSGDAKDNIKDCFEEKFGKETIACATDTEVKQLAHFAVKGIVVNRSLRTIIERSKGCAFEVVKKLGLNNKEVYSNDDLTESELKTFNSVKEIVKEALYNMGEVNVDTSAFQIVKFNNSSINGTYRGGKISLSRELLEDKFKTIGVLAHEYAHKYGDDGEKSHEAAMRNILVEVIKIAYTN